MNDMKSVNARLDKYFMDSIPERFSIAKWVAFLDKSTDLNIDQFNHLLSCGVIRTDKEIRNADHREIGEDDVEVFDMTLRIKRVLDAAKEFKIEPCGRTLAALQEAALS